MRRTSTGILALSLIGVYYLWRNRFEIQRFLAAQGIDLPLLSTGNVGEKLGSGAAKAVGKVQHGINQLGEQGRRAI